MPQTVPTSALSAWALVLAAGEGRRWGGNKLMAPVGGRPLISHVAATLAEARRQGLLGGTVAVVSGVDAALSRLLEEHGCRIAVNLAFASGLASSLRVGLIALECLEGEPLPGAALIAPGDQPALSVDMIARLVTAWRAGAGTVIRPRYAARPQAPGHPVLLDRSRWALADRLTGDVGLGPLLRDRPELVTTIEVPGDNPDLDTPADLIAFEKRLLDADHHSTADT
ncbi:MAG: nucleotidyltransferase family protein [Gemmatimonadales bacterium]